MGVFEIRISMKKKRERERERERERGEMEVFEKKSNTQREREREAHLEPSTRRSLNPKYSETLSSSTSSSSTFTRKYSQMPGLGRIANPTHGGDTMASCCSCFQLVGIIIPTTVLPQTPKIPIKRMLGFGLQKIKKKEKQEEEQNLKTIPAWVGAQVPIKSFEIFSEAEIAEMSQRI